MIENLTQKEAASRLGVSPSTLRRASDRVSRNDDGSYPWPIVKYDYEGAESLHAAEVGERLGLTPRRLRDLAKDGTISRNDDGSYPWPTVEVEYLAYREEHEDDRSAGFGDDAYQEARARKTAAQADLAELKAKEMRGELIPRRDVKELVRAPLEAVDRTLKAAPRKHAKRWARVLRITEAEALELIEALVEDVRGVLREIADAA